MKIEISKDVLELLENSSKEHLSIITSTSAENMYVYASTGSMEKVVVIMLCVFASKCIKTPNENIWRLIRDVKCSSILDNIYGKNTVRRFSAFMLDLSIGALFCSPIPPQCFEEDPVFQGFSQFKRLHSYMSQGVSGVSGVSRVPKKNKKVMSSDIKEELLNLKQMLENSPEEEEPLPPVYFQKCQEVLYDFFNYASLQNVEEKQRHIMRKIKSAAKIFEIQSSIWDAYKPICERAFQVSEGSGGPLSLSPPSPVCKDSESDSDPDDFESEFSPSIKNFLDTIDNNPQIVVVDDSPYIPGSSDMFDLITNSNNNIGNIQVLIPLSMQNKIREISQDALDAHQLAHESLAYTLIREYAISNPNFLSDTHLQATVSIFGIQKNSNVLGRDCDPERYNTVCLCSILMWYKKMIKRVNKNIGLKYGVIFDPSLDYIEDKTFGEAIGKIIMPGEEEDEEDKSL